MSIRTKSDWDEWLKKYTGALEKHWQRDEIERSIELKMAVEAGDYRAAEEIVHKIAFGTRKDVSRNKIRDKFDELLDPN